jgi:uncharacterized protein YkwD
MKRLLTFFPSVSKILILLLFSVFLLGFTDENKITHRLLPRDYKEYVKPDTSEVEQRTVEQEPAFDWSVEKVDEHITKISLPPDPRMSTVAELNEAMNNYRRAHALPTVDQNDIVCGIAQNRANEQLANGGLDNHAGFDKYAENQQEYTRMGEVLFGGNQPQYGVHIVEFGWNRSLTGHKEAIQNPEWRYGCGGIAGYYAVFIFGAK